MAIQFAAIGECLIELSEINLNQWQMHFAGDSYNTCFYLAKLAPQLNPAFVTALGDCPYSFQMKKSFEKANIDTQFVLHIENKQPGLYLINNDATGERTFYYYRSDSAAKFLFEHPDTEKLISSLYQIPCLYFTGITLAILSSHSREKFIAFLKKAKSAGVKLFCDNNYRQRLWPSAKISKEIMQSIWPLLDGLFVTFSDEKNLFNDVNSEETLARYHSFSIPLIVVKDGNRPCLARYYQDTFSVAAADVDNVVDTTGAGDAFNAGFLNHYLNHQQIIEALKQGHLLASRVIQQKGALI